MGKMPPFLSFPNLRNVGKDSRYVIQSEAKDLRNIKWESPELSIRSSRYIVTFPILFNLIAVLNKRRTFLFSMSVVLDKNRYICVIK